MASSKGVEAGDRKAGTAWKMPPLVKVYEALAALGDGRVRIIDTNRAAVSSSGGTKVYDVETSADGCEISSNDNASYWQGYLGYPAIAVLLARGRLRAPAPGVTAALSGIPWREINRHFRNDYAKTLEEVDRRIRDKGRDPKAVRAEASAVLDALEKLGPLRGRRRRPPREASRGHGPNAGR